MEMNDWLFYFISSCLFWAIIHISIGIFFTKKNVSFFLHIIVWIAFYTIEIIGSNYIDMPILRLNLEIIYSLCICMMLYCGSKRKKLIWILVINLLGMIAETVIGYIFIFANVEISQTEVLASFISEIMLLMILMGLKISNHSRSKRDMLLKYWCILFCMSVGSIFVLYTIIFLYTKIEDKSVTVFDMIFSAFVLKINFFALHIYENLLDRIGTQKQQIIFDKQIQLYKKQILEQEESNLNIRNIRHDIKNHLICIKECMDRNDLEYAKKYIHELLNGENYLKINSIMNSGNIVVDALVNYKYIEMQRLKIELETHIEIPYKMEFNDADICVILGNCLDNSIEAVSMIENLQLKKISIELIYRKNNLLLKIMNPYNGILKCGARGEYITTKENAKNHGVGLKSVKKAVQKYNGLVEINSENGIFQVQILLYASSANCK